MNNYTLLLIDGSMMSTLTADIERTRAAFNDAIREQISKAIEDLDELNKLLEEEETLLGLA